jgi:hypothetical protein
MLPDPAAEPSSEAHASGVRLPVAVLSSLALLQAALVFAASGSLSTRIIAAGLTLAGVFVRLRTLGILAGLIVVNFCVHLAVMTPPIPYRVAHVTVLALYGAVALAGLATAIFPRLRFTPALALTSTLALALVTTEIVIGQVAPEAVLGQTVKWRGGPQADPVLGDIYPPYGLLGTVYPSNPRSYFEQEGASASSGFAVTYSLNALGCRGRDHPIPRPPGRRRILVLGGSSVFGVGVREADTLAARLERSLDAGSQQAEPPGYDVINCGEPGYGTREQRLFYEQMVSRYEAPLVIVVVTDHDNLSHRDELQLGYGRPTPKFEKFLLSARLLQYARHEGGRPFDYSTVAVELGKLGASCRARDARLAVVLFGSADLSRHWNDLVRAVSERFQGTDVPVLDLGLVLLKEQAGGNLTVHPLDPNLNEIAHRIAAESTERFLRRWKLVGRI